MDTSGSEVLGAAPKQEDAEARRLRAGLQHALFGSEARVEIGRYRLGDVLGRGGVGVVYRAHDPSLQRDVALKLLRVQGGSSPGDTRARERMLREARAMAALDHPDIVPIYDVGTDGDELYIAMELVEGGTLRDWLETMRAPEDVIAAFTAAGRGLAAAHEAGLVHRDFKPDNVLVGPGSRMRVSDFGLVREVEEASTREPESASRSGPALPTSRGSETGGVATRGAIGTPGYMAPEQRRGEKVSAAADQYSFCVALCEALTGDRPADADEADKLLARVDGRRRAAIVRGLATDPTARWPDMRTLLVALAPARAGRAAWLGAGLLAVVAVGAWTMRGDQAAATDAVVCSPAPSPYGKERRHALTARFGSLGPRFAAEVWPRIDGALQRRSQTYEAVWGEVCAGAADEPAKLPAQRQCLSNAAESMAGLLATLEQIDAAGAESAVLSAMRLPDPNACVDAEDRSEVDMERWDATLALVHEAADAMNTGDYARVRDRAAVAIAEAEKIGATPLAENAHFYHAEGLWRLGRMEEAAAELTEVALGAAAAGRHSTAVAASTRLIWITGVDLAQLEEARRWDRQARTSIERLDGDPYAEAERLQALGQVLMTTGNTEEAIATLKEARRRFVEVFGPNSPHVGSADLNVGMALANAGQSEPALPFLERALANAVATVGDDHPTTAIAHLDLGTTLGHLGRYEEAREHLERSLAIKRERLGAEHPEVGIVLNNLARVELAMGDEAQARQHNEAAAVLVAEGFPEGHPGHGFIHLVQAKIELAASNFAEAETEARRAAESFEPAMGPESRNVVEARDLQRRAAAAAKG